MDEDKERSENQTPAEHFWSAKRQAAGQIPRAEAAFSVQGVNTMPDGVWVEVYFDG